jgi:hypothetical protein
MEALFWFLLGVAFASNFWCWLFQYEIKAARKRRSLRRT